MELAALAVWGTLFLFENETIFPSSCSSQPGKELT